MQGATWNVEKPVWKYVQFLKNSIRKWQVQWDGLSQQRQMFVCLFFMCMQGVNALSREIYPSIYIQREAMKVGPTMK